uniref:RRM domain-containing protein n=1 Tax=Kalanchoe fedtschenkoi TaxID=63787 RepID=A0A7N0TQB3_KALFE
MLEMGGEDRTFKVSFTTDGIERLQNEVMEKLKEFMGDYTDDTLVEYVIVLLRNGRTKDEAKNELNVFLGDEDCSSFVTWLWDHLSANLNLYVQSDDSHLNEEAKQKAVSRDLGTSQSLRNPDCGPEKDRFDPIADKVDKITENLHTKSASKTHSNLRSQIGRTHLEEKIRHIPDRTRKSLSPRPSSHRKRNRLDDRHHIERKIGSLAAINPSRRLLQFAVREAVGTAGVASKTIEPNSKRLRSMVAAVDDSRRRLRSVATVSPAAEVALKAAAEAAEDVLRVRPSGNVFDRLGRGMDEPDSSETTAYFTDNIADGDYEFHDKVAVQPQLNQRRVIKASRRYASNKRVRSTRIELINHETEFATDVYQDQIDDADTDAMGYRNRSSSQTRTSVQMDDDAATTRHINSANSHKLKHKYQNQLAAVVHPSYDENVNIPGNANIRKPLPYMSKNVITGANSSSVILSGDVGDGTLSAHLLKENSNGVPSNGNEKSALFHKMELQKTHSRDTGAAANVVSLEIANARTLFVCNVHFAASKESLSRHFSKFGQVLRVIILADAATGQPKGSAYVEFMKKEAAEQATSLDGTSFMSRIIKVCMKGSAQPEAKEWPRAVPRGSPFPVPRLSRAPFPRGSSSTFRGRGTGRPAARSLQWMREGQRAPATNEAAGAISGNSGSNPVRRLTYVRPGLKAEGAST